MGWEARTDPRRASGPRGVELMAVNDFKTRAELGRRQLSPQVLCLSLGRTDSAEPKVCLSLS